MAKLLKGAPVAASITEEVAQRAEALRKKGVIPTLAVIRVGEKPDDISYETGIAKRCEKAGVALRRFILPEGCSKEELLDVVGSVNGDDGIHGCLMFRPLSDKSAEEAACALLDPKKDVDCMTLGALAGVFTGKGEGYPPCTARACMEILKSDGIDLTGKRVTVIGRSLVIGKPVSMMLMAENATVTVCHTKTKDMPSVCRNAEILVAAAGKAKTVGADFVSPGQVIIDVGINVDDEGRLCGDVDFDSVEPIVSAITPVPGGVGSVTTAVLVKHVVEAAEKSV